MRIGIIGQGMVGSAVKAYFKDAVVYDKYKKIGSMAQINRECDLVFLCLPTPSSEENGFDIAEIDKTIPKIRRDIVIVIKSTVIPFCVDKYQQQYPDRRFLFCPEFLKEYTAKEDFAHPDRVIIGYTNDETKKVAMKLATLMPKSGHTFIIPSEQAEMTKLVSNVFLTFKVIFFNLIYDVCQKLGIDYEMMLPAITSDRRIGDSHTTIWHNEGRGAGGHCFPKDLFAFIWLLAKIKFQHIRFFRFVENVNNQYLRRSGKK